MKLRRHTVVVAAFLSLTSFALHGADQYSLGFTKNSTRMTWRPSFPGWTYTFPVTYSAADASNSKVRVSLSAGMGYTLDQRDGTNLWQDRANIRGSVSYPILGPKATIGINGSMSSSNSALQKQKIRSQSYGFSFQFKPLQDGAFKSMSVSLTPGLITAQRASRAKPDSTIKETGIQYTASLRVSPSKEVAGQRMNTSISLSKRDNTLKNNKNRNESLSLSWKYTLPKDVVTSLSVSESRSERGVTRSVITESNIDGEAVRDTTLGAELAQNRNTSVRSSVKFKVGRYDVSQNMTYTETSNMNTANAEEDLRNNYFGRDREKNSWRFSTKLSGKVTEKLVGSTNVNYTASDEGRLSIRLANGTEFRDSSSDRQDRDLQLVGALDWRLKDQHSLKLSGQVRLISDDNPGAPEQDQDAFSRSTRLSYNGTTRSGTSLTAGLSSSFSHRVSLHAARSSNNSRTSNLALDLATRYKRMGIDLSHNFSVSARRSIFDFDRQVNPSEGKRKSNIRRGWKMSHTANRKIFDELKANGRYTYSADDFGKLIVDSGAQLLEVDNSDHAIAFGITYNPASVFSASVNTTYRLDRQWEHTYVRLLEERNLLRRNEHRNIGANIRYKPSSVTSLTLAGSRSRQRSGTFDTFSVNYNRKI